MAKILIANGIISSSGQVSLSSSTFSIQAENGNVVLDGISQNTEALYRILASDSSNRIYWTNDLYLDTITANTVSSSNFTASNGVIYNDLIISGSTTGNFTGSLKGTASFVISASHSINSDLLGGNPSSYYLPTTCVSGTATYIPKFTSANSIGNSVIYQSASFISIGTTSASANLHVEGSGSALFKVDGYNGTLFTVEDDLSDSLMSVNDASGLPVFEVFADDTVIAGRYNQRDFYIQGSDGNIGIGTNMPTKRLTISGSISASGDFYLDQRLYDIYNSSGSGQQILTAIGNGNKWYNLIDISGSITGSGTQNYLSIWDTVNSLSSSGIYQDSNGNIGLGTTSPSTKLHIVGNLTFDTSTGRDILFGDNLGAALEFKEGSNLYQRFVTTNGSEEIQMYKDVYMSSDQVVVGNVGIGTTAPSTKLHLFTATSDDIVLRMDANDTGNSYIELDRQTSNGCVYIKLQDATTNKWSFGSFCSDRLDFLECHNTNCNRLSIVTGGNIGIGTTSPSQKTQIDGNLRVTGSYYDSYNSPGTLGQILKSTTNGTQWSNIVLSGGVFGGNFTGSISGSQGTFDNITVIYSGSFGYVLSDTISGSKAFIYSLYDSNESSGSINQVLTSTSDGIEWKSDITASLYGTASWSTNSISSSYLSGSRAIVSELTASYISATKITSSNGGYFNNKVTIDGDLLVSGQSMLFSASYINITSSNVNIGDNIITLNAYSPFQTYAGIEMHDSGSGAIAQFLWDSDGNYFFVSGSTATNSQNQVLLGPDGKVDLTAGYLPVSYNSNELSSSVIYQAGSNIGIGTTTLLNTLTVNGNAYFENAVTASVVTSSYIDLDVLTNGSSPAYKEGRMFYNGEEGALTLYNNESEISLQVGQEFYVRVYNSSGASITDGLPVYISGSQGDNPYVWESVAEDHTTTISYDNHIIGVSTHTIENNSVGYVTTQGIVRGIDTTAFSAGDILYVQTSSAGFRNTPPPFPYDIIKVGYVVRSHSNGFIYVHPQEPVHFSNISGLSGSFDAHVGDLWVYQSNNAWTHTKLVPEITSSVISSSNIYVSNLFDSNSSSGSSGQILSSTGTGTDWTNLIDISGAITGSGNTNYLPIWDTSNSLSSSGIYQDSNGNIGIGTTSPSQMLELKGANAVLRLKSTGSGSLASAYTEYYDCNNIRLGYMGYGSGNNNFLIYNCTGDGNVTIVSQCHFAIYTNNNLTVILPDGNVGIGTVAPSQKLQVAGNIRVTGSYYDSNNSAGSSGQILSSTATGTDWINLIDITGAITGSGTQCYIPKWNTSTSLNNSGMYEDSNGNIGIGTTSPAYKLHVLNADTWQSRFSYDSNRYLNVGYQGILATYGSNGNDMYVGTVSAGASNGHLIFQTIGSERARVSRDGNVGIGTTSPSQKLHVAGNIRVTGSYYDSNNSAGSSGQILSSTGTGTDWLNLIDISGAITGSGTQNYLTIWNTSNSLSSSGIYQDNNGNIGIGTLTSSANLHVEGSGSALFKVDGYNGTLFTVEDDLSDSLMSVNDASGLPVFEVFADDTVIAGRYNQRDFYIQGSDGNIGIGTNLPSTRLTISGSISASGDFYLDQRLYDISNSSGSGQQILTAIGNGNKWHNLIDISGSITGSGTQNYLPIWDTVNSLSSSILYQDSNGNIGIGTASPSTKLHIVGNLTFDTSAGRDILFGDNLGAALEFKEGSNLYQRFVTTNGSEEIQFYNDVYMSSDQVVVGNISASGDLYLDGALYDVNDSAGAVGSILTSTGTAVEWASGDINISGAFEGNFTGSITGSYGIFDNITIIETGSFGYIVSNVVSGSDFYIYDLNDRNDSTGSNQQILISTKDGIEWSDYTVISGSISGSGTTNYTALWTDGNELSSSNIYQDGNGNIGIGTSSPSYKLEVNGEFAAPVKHFIVNDPTTGKKLVHSSLEGPENGVYIRGKSTKNSIKLPEYWQWLIDKESISVNLTPIGKHQHLSVKSITDTEVIVDNTYIDRLFRKKLNYHYIIFAERKDVNKLQIYK